MKPKPEVRVLAKQLFRARGMAIERRIAKSWPQEKLEDMELPIQEVWDAVAREAIRRLKK